MKKIILAITLLALIIYSCNKADAPVTLQKDRSAYVHAQKNIEDFRLRIEKKKIDRTPGTLGKIQTALEYAGADATGARTGFSLTSWWCGPAYGGAFALIGAVCGSTYLYIHKHYNYNVVNPPAGGDGTGTFEGVYNRAGYLHNKELIKTFSNGINRPTSVAEYVNAYFPVYCSDIANELNINPDDIKAAGSKEKIIAFIETLGDNITPDNIKTSLENIGVEPVFINNYDLFMKDVFNNRITTKEEVLELINLYQELYIANVDLPLETKEQLLYCTAIFKYSYCMWSNNEL